MDFTGGSPVVIPSSRETSSGICRSSLSFLTTLAWSYQVSNLNLLDQPHGLIARRPEWFSRAGTTTSLWRDSSDRLFLDRQEPHIGGDCFSRRKYTKVWYCHDATSILWKMGCEFQNLLSPSIDPIVQQTLEVLLKEWRKDRTNKVLIFTKSVKLLEMLDFHLQTRGRLILSASLPINSALRISGRLWFFEAGRKHQATWSFVVVFFFDLRFSCLYCLKVCLWSTNSIRIQMSTFSWYRRWQEVLGSI